MSLSVVLPIILLLDWSLAPCKEGSFTTKTEVYLVGFVTFSPCSSESKISVMLLAGGGGWGWSDSIGVLVRGYCVCMVNKI